MTGTETAIREALGALIVPGTGKHFDMECLESLLVSGDRITCILRGEDDQTLRDAVKATVERVQPGSRVLVVSTRQKPAEPERDNAPGQKAGDSGVGPVRQIVAVASGKGGVGKSTVTVNLAVLLASRGLRVGILDADIYGPSVPMMLGCEDRSPDGDDGGRVIVPVPAHGLVSLSIGYMLRDKEPLVWRGPMVHSALKQMLDNTRWGALDILLIDMPPGTGDVALTIAQHAGLRGAVIVTTPQNVALADARKGIGMFRKVEVPILGLIENMASHACPHCGEVSAIFGHDGGRREAEQQDVPFLGGLPLVPECCADSDAGTPAVLREGVFRTQFEAIADGLLSQLEESG